MHRSYTYGMPARHPDLPIRTGILALLVAPFLLNDISNIYIKDWQWWLTIDYGAVKLLPLGIVAWWIHNGYNTLPELGLNRQRLQPFVSTLVAVTLAGTLLDQNGYRAISQWPGFAALGGMPAIDNRLWDWIDLTLGLALVAIVEELVFRGYVLDYLQRLRLGPLAILILSSLLFGSIHWSLGLHAILVTAAIGALFMGTYLFTRSLPAIMAAHFMINFIDFAGVIPKTVFQFHGG